jgi:hypothetical protein
LQKLQTTPDTGDGDDTGDGEPLLFAECAERIHAAAAIDRAAANATMAEAAPPAAESSRLSVSI